MEGDKKMRTVTEIPATIDRYTHSSLVAKKKKRVAGYARVSTQFEEQQGSYIMQMKYYRDYIKAHDDWKLVKVYGDDGVSGTSTSKRGDFQAMMKDALKGKIDMIVTKSISRFGRNTVDTLVAVRKLKERGIGVYFEKENIYTLDTKGEVLITIMSALAQDESRNISENTTWGHRKKFASGRFSLAYSKFLGYDKGPDGKLVINEEQAKVVRLIYRLFLEGYTHKLICRILEEKGIKTAAGRSKWYWLGVNGVLTNEKYKGDALLQKTFTTDFLTKKEKKNEGEIPQYYIKDDHPAIIPPAIFDMVQDEIAKRKKLHRNSSGEDLFMFTIKCGNCGAWYGRKTWHSNDKYRSHKYICNSRYDKGKKKCPSPALTETDIVNVYIKVVNKLFRGVQQDVVDGIASLKEVMPDKADVFERLAARLTDDRKPIKAYDRELWRNFIDEIDVFPDMHFNVKLKDESTTTVYLD